MHEPERCRDSLEWTAVGYRGGDSGSPPAVVERSRFVPVNDTKRNLGRRAPERDTKRLPAVIVHAHGARWNVGAGRHVAAVNPWMAGGYAACALGRDAGDSGRRLVRAGHGGKVGRRDRQGGLAAV